MLIKTQILRKGIKPTFTAEKDSHLKLYVLDDKLKPNDIQIPKKFAVPLHKITPEFLEAAADLLDREDNEKALFVISPYNLAGVAVFCTPPKEEAKIGNQILLNSSQKFIW